MNKQELEDRLIKFAVLIIKISDLLPNTRAGATIANQIVRSGTSPALNYGEAQSAESSRDFIHKNQVVLKELRETFVALKIIKMSEMVTSENLIESALLENNELISIFVATINTMKNNVKS
jgi:four helix bundle protein